MVVNESTAARRFDLLVDVDQILQSSCYSAVRNICYGLCDGKLILEGKVPSYFIKQLAQTLVASVADEGIIENQLQVERTTHRGPHHRTILADKLVSVS